MVFVSFFAIYNYLFETFFSKQFDYQKAKSTLISSPEVRSKQYGNGK